MHIKLRLKQGLHLIIMIALMVSTVMTSLSLGAMVTDTFSMKNEASLSQIDVNYEKPNLSLSTRLMEGQHAEASKRVQDPGPGYHYRCDLPDISCHPRDSSFIGDREMAAELKKLGKDGGVFGIYPYRQEGGGEEALGFYLGKTHGIMSPTSRDKFAGKTDANPEIEIIIDYMGGMLYWGHSTGVHVSRMGFGEYVGSYMRSVMRMIGGGMLILVVAFGRLIEVLGTFIYGMIDTFNIYNYLDIGAMAVKTGNPANPESEVEFVREFVRLVDHAYRIGLIISLFTFALGLALTVMGINLGKGNHGRSAAFKGTLGRFLVSTFTIFGVSAMMAGFVTWFSTTMGMSIDDLGIESDVASLIVDFESYITAGYNPRSGIEVIGTDGQFIAEVKKIAEDKDLTPEEKRTKMDALRTDFLGSSEAEIDASKEALEHIRNANMLYKQVSLVSGTPQSSAQGFPNDADLTNIPTLKELNQYPSIEGRIITDAAVVAMNAAGGYVIDQNETVFERAKSKAPSMEDLGNLGGSSGGYLTESQKNSMYARGMAKAIREASIEELSNFASGTSGRLINGWMNGNTFTGATMEGRYGDNAILTGMFHYKVDGKFMYGQPDDKQWNQTAHYSFSLPGRTMAFARFMDRMIAILLKAIFAMTIYGMIIGSIIDMFRRVFLRIWGAIYTGSFASLLLVITSAIVMMLQVLISRIVLAMFVSLMDSPDQILGNFIAKSTGGAVLNTIPMMAPLFILIGRFIIGFVGFKGLLRFNKAFGSSLGAAAENAAVRLAGGSPRDRSDMRDGGGAFGKAGSMGQALQDGITKSAIVGGMLGASRLMDGDDVPEGEAGENDEYRGPDGAVPEGEHAEGGDYAEDEGYAGNGAPAGAAGAKDVTDSHFMNQKKLGDSGMAASEDDIENEASDSQEGSGFVSSAPEGEVGSDLYDSGEASNEDYEVENENEAQIHRNIATNVGEEVSQDTGIATSGEAGEAPDIESSNTASDVDIESSRNATVHAVGGMDVDRESDNLNVQDQHEEAQIQDTLDLIQNGDVTVSDMSQVTPENIGEGLAVTDANGVSNGQKLEALNESIEARQDIEMATTLGEMSREEMAEARAMNDPGVYSGAMHNLQTAESLLSIAENQRVEADSNLQSMGYEGEMTTEGLAQDRQATVDAVMQQDVAWQTETSGGSADSGTIESGQVSGSMETSSQTEGLAGDQSATGYTRIRREAILEGDDAPDIVGDHSHSADTSSTSFNRVSQETEIESGGVTGTSGTVASGEVGQGTTSVQETESVSRTLSGQGTSGNVGSVEQRQVGVQESENVSRTSTGQGTSGNVGSVEQRQVGVQESENVSRTSGQSSVQSGSVEQRQVGVQESENVSRTSGQGVQGVSGQSEQRQANVQESENVSRASSGQSGAVHSGHVEQRQVGVQESENVSRSSTGQSGGQSQPQNVTQNTTVQRNTSSSPNRNRGSGRENSQPTNFKGGHVERNIRSETQE